MAGNQACGHREGIDAAAFGEALYDGLAGFVNVAAQGSLVRQRRGDGDASIEVIGVRGAIRRDRKARLRELMANSECVWTTAPMPANDR